MDDGEEVEFWLDAIVTTVTLQKGKEKRAANFLIPWRFAMLKTKKCSVSDSWHIRVEDCVVRDIPFGCSGGWRVCENMTPC